MFTVKNRKENAYADTFGKKASKKEADRKTETVHHGAVYRIGCIIGHPMCRDPYPYGQEEGRFHPETGRRRRLYSVYGRRIPRDHG